MAEYISVKGCGSFAAAFVESLQTLFDPVPFSVERLEKVSETSYKDFPGLCCAGGAVLLCLSDASLRHVPPYVRFPHTSALADKLLSLNPRIENAYAYAAMITRRNDAGYIALAWEWLKAALSHGWEEVVQNYEWTDNTISVFNRRRKWRDDCGETPPLCDHERNILRQLDKDAVPSAEPPVG